MNHCVWLLFIDLNGIGITTVFNWGKKTFRLTWLELVFYFSFEMSMVEWWWCAFFSVSSKCHFTCSNMGKGEELNFKCHTIPGCCVICYENRKWPWKGCIVRDFWCCRNIHSLNINLSEWIIHFHYTLVVAAGVAAGVVALVSVILIWIDK